MTRKTRIAAAVGGAVGLIAAVTLILLWPRHRTAAVFASGTVEVTETDLGFQVPGRIDSVLVHEGDSVRVGQLLGRLDPAELEARLHAAEGQRGAAAARLTELERGYRSEEVAQAREAARAATERGDEAQREVERARRLFAGGAISRHQLESAETAFAVADAQRVSAEEQLRLLQTGPRAEQVAAQRALVAQARAAVAQADAALTQGVMRSPFDGHVTIRHREPGEIVPAGAPVVTVANPADRWVRIYVRGDEVGRLAIGQPAEIRADAYPDRVYGGAIAYISSEAEFTPRNVQTTEERVKLVYRVKVQIVDDPRYDLKPGLPADVRIAPRTP
jgi:HlyD family secretion protein